MNTEINTLIQSRKGMYKTPNGAWDFIQTGVETGSIFRVQVKLKIYRMMASEPGSEMYEDSIKDIYGYKYCWDNMVDEETKSWYQTMYDTCRRYEQYRDVVLGDIGIDAGEKQRMIISELAECIMRCGEEEDLDKMVKEAEWISCNPLWVRR